MALDSVKTADAKKWPAFGAVAFLVAIPCALFLPALLAGKMSFGFDTVALAVPFHAEVVRCLAAHEWPLWLNGVFGGMPGIASCNLQFVYPTDFIGNLCGLSLRALDGLDAVTNVALAGLGMFLFLLRLKRSLSGALLGAFFFALSGSELAQVLGGFYNMMGGVAWAPWAFWAAHKAREERKLFAWGLCGLAFAMQILAGATQLFAYTLPAVACFVLAPLRDPVTERIVLKERLSAFRPILAGLALALGLAFLLSAPQLWLTLQYLPLAARHALTYGQFIAGSISPSEALTWLVPGLFGWQEPTYHGAMVACFTSDYFGLLPWALAAAALYPFWRREPLVRWMAAMALVAFFLAQRRWTPLYAVFQSLPVLSGFRNWARALFLVTFAVCTLAAYGWDALRSPRTRTGALGGAAVFWILALTAAAFAWGVAKESAAAAPAMPWISPKPRVESAILSAQAFDSLKTTWILLAVGAALLWFSTKRLGTGTALVLALAFHGLDLSSMVTRDVRFVDPQTEVGKPDFTVPPPHAPGMEPWRIFDSDNRTPNNAMVLGYENLGGTESMGMQSYLLTQEAMDPSPARWKDWLNLMNVRYIFRHSVTSPYLPGDKVGVYENRGAFPRAWLVGRSLKVSGDDAAYRLLANPGFHPRTEVALDADAGLDGTAPLGAVRWTARSPQAFSLAVSTDRAAALLVSNAWYPSWKADVDGQDAPVLKADGGLQAVLLKAGNHQVDFRFDPGLFYDALAACMAGLAFLLGLWRHDAQNRRLREP